MSGKINRVDTYKDLESIQGQSSEVIVVGGSGALPLMTYQILNHAWTSLGCRGVFPALVKPMPSPESKGPRGRWGGLK